VFGLVVAAASTLLMAPQTNEFGTKVALLAGLVVVCAARPVVDRLGLLAGWRATGAVARAGLVGVCSAVVAAGIVAAGSPARGGAVPGVEDVLDRVPHDIDPATFPAISVEQDVADWNHEIAGAGAQELLLTVAENLELESQALLRADPTILEAVDHGDRLDEMRQRIDDAETSGVTVVEWHHIEDVNVTLLEPFGRQDGLSLGLEARGTVTEETYDAAGDLRARTSSPFAATFVVRQATGGRWLNVAVLPLDDVE
jgi:hypothetical protein